MAKAFSILSWNVEHFGKKKKSSAQPKKPVGPIIDLIAAQSADVLAIYEVVGQDVYLKSPIVQIYKGWEKQIRSRLDNDEDLAVVGNQVSLHCPLSKELMVDAVKNPDCGHIYSKRAVTSVYKTAYFDCPVAGCVARRTQIANLVDDMQIRVLAKREQKKKKQRTA